MSRNGAGLFYGIWCLTPLSIFQLYRCGQFYWSGNHRPAASHWQTLAHNFYISSTHRLSAIRTHNVSGDRQRVLIKSSYCRTTYFSGPPWVFVLWLMSFHVTTSSLPVVREPPIVKTRRCSKARRRSRCTFCPSVLSGK
jgi:hypothetical protein